MHDQAPNVVSPVSPVAVEAEARVHRTLARRLEQLRDAAWTGRILGEALSRMAGRPIAVGDVRIDYCKIKPNRDIQVAALASVRAPGSGAETTLRMSLAFYAEVERAREKWAEHDGRVALDRLADRPELAGFRRLMLLVDDPLLIVRIFPADPGLPGLAHATDVATMGDLLVAPGDGGPPRPARTPRYDVLHYKPGRSCGLHYTWSEDGRGPREAYGKVYRDDRGERCYALLEAAWQAARQSGGAFRAARPLAFLPEWRMTVQDAVTGRQFRHLFADLTHDHATEAELEPVRAHLRAIARGIAALQQAPLPPGPDNTFDRLLAAQDKNLAYMSRSEPHLAGEIARIRGALEGLARRTPASEPVFSHGDFAHGNVLIDDGVDPAVGMIDFDRAGRAEPAYDVAYFLTHMWSFGIRHPRRQPHVAPLCDVFRRAYLDCAPRVEPRRLAVYEALDFVAYVLRNFRKQSHQESWRQWARGQVDAAWRRLDVAGGGGGGKP